MSDYLLITGMSGAGRSTTADALEDSGWYVIDNMPPSLLAEVVDVVGAPGSGQDRVALVIGRSGGAQVEQAFLRSTICAPRGTRCASSTSTRPTTFLCAASRGRAADTPSAAAT